MYIQRWLNYTFDKWLEIRFPTVQYERYADDAVIHCASKSYAEYALKALQQRMQECNLELHSEKTKLVYCRDYRRQGNYKTVKFDFLGYSFQPCTIKSKRIGKLFLGYDCAISISLRKRIADKLEDLNIIKMSCKSIVDIAQKLNPYIRGWVNYYGKYRGYELSKVFHLLRTRLVRWAKKRYKRYRNNLNKAYKWLGRVRRQFPYLFYHWKLGFSD